MSFLFKAFFGDIGVIVSPQPAWWSHYQSIVCQLLSLSVHGLLGGVIFSPQSEWQCHYQSIIFLLVVLSVHSLPGGVIVSLFSACWVQCQSIVGPLVPCQSIACLTWSMAFLLVTLSVHSTQLLYYCPSVEPRKFHCLPIGLCSTGSPGSVLVPKSSFNLWPVHWGRGTDGQV